MSALLTQAQLTYEISPIILTGGIAQNILGGMLPIVALTEGPNFTDGLLIGTTEGDLDDFFAHFVPIPGGTLEENQIGMYPFANQAIAANAIIVQPRHISLRMTAPAKPPIGYITKLATMSALEATLSQHRNLGGTYTVITPSQIYTNCILEQIKDVSTGELKQPQFAWQWDFIQPLVSLQQIQQAQSALMNKITNGLPTDGSWSGPSTQIGYQPGGSAPVALGANQPLGGISPTTSPIIGSIGPGTGQ